MTSRQAALTKRAAVALVTGVAIASPLVVSIGTAASADPIGNARARAAALAKTVAKLADQAELATERYDAVESQLQQAVTQRILAQRDLDEAQAGAVAAQSVSADRVRALYESGGPSTLLATVLDGADLTDALSRYEDVSLLLGTDHARVMNAQQRAAHAAAIEARLTAAAAAVTKLQSAAARAATHVEALLAAQQDALSSANAQVRALLAAQQAAALAASAADFAAAVQAAGGQVGGDTAAPNATVAQAINAARSKLGDPYQWGGTGPDAYDCSGLTQFAYASAGVALPRVAADQWNVGTHVGLADLEPGDLLFWATDTTNAATIHHVAIYLGDGMMLAAPHTGDVVKIEPVYMDGFIGATRPWQSD